MNWREFTEKHDKDGAIYNQYIALGYHECGKKLSQARQKAKRLNKALCSLHGFNDVLNPLSPKELKKAQNQYEQLSNLCILIHIIDAVHCQLYVEHARSQCD